MRACTALINFSVCREDTNSSDGFLSMERKYDKLTRFFTGFATSYKFIQNLKYLASFSEFQEPCYKIYVEIPFKKNL